MSSFIVSLLLIRTKILLFNYVTIGLSLFYVNNCTFVKLKQNKDYTTEKLKDTLKYF